MYATCVRRGFGGATAFALPPGACSAPAPTGEGCRVAAVSLHPPTLHGAPWGGAAAATRQDRARGQDDGSGRGQRDEWGGGLGSRGRPSGRAGEGAPGPAPEMPSLAPSAPHALSKTEAAEPEEETRV